MSCELCDQFRRALDEPKNSGNLRRMLQDLYAKHRTEVHSHREAA